jgi:hypothetical protein
MVSNNKTKLGGMNDRETGKLTGIDCPGDQATNPPEVHGRGKDSNRPRMASGAIVINGYGFDEMTWEKSNKVMELIDEKQQEEAARSPYLDPAKNLMIRLD